MSKSEPRKPKPRKISNKKLKDPEWYVSLAADILDLKFATLAKDLGKALNPQVTDTAKELLALYQLAFEATLQSQQVDCKATVDKGSESFFFDHIIDPNVPSYHPVFQQLMKPVALSYINQQTDNFTRSWSEVRSAIRREFGINFNSLIQSGSAEYANAAKYIELLKTQVAPVESKVIAHMNGVLKDLEYENLAIDPDLTLRKSYVTPTCQVRLDKIQQTTGEAKEAVFFKVVVIYFLFLRCFSFSDIFNLIGIQHH
jgi:hypothetical protein